jgi:hypothetical protein
MNRRAALLLFAQQGVGTITGTVAITVAAPGLAAEGSVATPPVGGGGVRRGGMGLMGRFGFALFGGGGRRRAALVAAGDGQWDFSDATQSGHLLTAGF